MNERQVRMAKREIFSKDYRRRRMSAMSEKINHWMLNETTANTARYRDFCRKMQDMYYKRYDFYLKDKLKKFKYYYEPWKRNADDPQGVRSVA